MSQPPHSPYPQEPYSGQPGSGAPQGDPGAGTPPPPPDHWAPPPDQPGFPPGQPGFSPAQSGFPPAQSGYSPGQPGFPPAQPGFPPGQPGFPQAGFPPPQQKSSALKIVLIVVAVIAVLCVGGVAVAFVAAGDKINAVINASKIEISEPATLGGRAKLTDPALVNSMSELERELAKVPGSTSSVSAFYGDVTAQDIVMVAAASSTSGSAQDRFDDLVSGLSIGPMKLNNFTDTDPGPLGGLAKCGESGTPEIPIAVCAWSDDGSIGMFLMLFKAKADLEKEFVAMRGEVEQKS